MIYLIYLICPSCENDTVARYVQVPGGIIYLVRLDVAIQELARTTLPYVPTGLYTRGPRVVRVGVFVCKSHRRFFFVHFTTTVVGSITMHSSVACAKYHTTTSVLATENPSVKVLFLHHSEFTQQTRSPSPRKKYRRETSFVKHVSRACLPSHGGVSLDFVRPQRVRPAVRRPLRPRGLPAWRPRRPLRLPLALSLVWLAGRRALGLLGGRSPRFRPLRKHDGVGAAVL